MGGDLKMPKTLIADALSRNQGTVLMGVNFLKLIFFTYCEFGNVGIVISYVSVGNWW